MCDTVYACLFLSQRNCGYMLVAFQNHLFLDVDYMNVPWLFTFQLPFVWLCIDIHLAIMVLSNEE